MESDLVFNLSDMLRGKCLFGNVTKINKCADKIII